jgi:amidophosphoribosyltransferase
MCGIIGIIHASEVAEEIFLGLQNLQHRGQDGGGIVTLDDEGIHQHHGAGLLDIAFPVENFKRLRGEMGVGHTRYTTTGKKETALLQPFVSEDLGLAIAHNGNILNYHALRREILNENPTALRTDSDSEVILQLLSQSLASSGSTPDTLLIAVQNLSQRLVGSYSVIGFAKNIGLFAFRDPHGLRPLIIGSRPNSTGNQAVAVASESTALEFIGYTHLEDIAPGELIIVSAEGQITRHRYTAPTPRHCMFEWVYFARVESTLDHLPVYQARFNLGVQLAQEVMRLGLEPDIVVPVPETSRISAIALAEALQKPFREVLIKNRYVNRTFILESQAARLEAINRKLYPVASALRGKKVLIVDDSIVRGNTAIKIIELLRKSGAEEIYLASTCPPIRYPCYYGIDFPDQDELLAGRYDQEKLPGILGVDALVYQTLDGLGRALQTDTLCTACLTGTYPTETGEALEFSKQRLIEREMPV